MRTYGFSRRDEAEEKWIRMDSGKSSVSRFYRGILSKKGRKAARRLARKEAAISGED